MKEIIKLILKYHFTIIFILLEVLSFSLIVLHNNYQRTVFSGYTASFFGTISSVVTRVDDYFYLKVTNEKLVAENTELRNEIEKLKLLNRISNADTLWAPTDSADVDYVYKTAEMINSSFNKTKNYIVIDKGATEGIKPEMAVCSSEGVVGIIEKVSNRYARVLPLINTNLRISAKIKKKRLLWFTSMGRRRLSVFLSERHTLSCRYRSGRYDCDFRIFQYFPGR